ncbi:phage tail assembly protein T [Noviherbaspirillum suwonense]|jgi:hypothetical protein|uniref:Minor tail T domain-containing protein n=1 Tax=Noviherbaspirillum suwonense TaxID=1224511 RepID=A0ABY1QK85_9BURK|nr:DUF4035 domain-containing protein [Noviherbaspirillum suwonense]SMP71972.1 hypothetical protein SAMN06295970_117103 [Noviherbaspirillum suwonense]
MSVRQAQREIDSAEFNEWMAYYSLEPFGEQIADIRHGIAVSTLANINRDAKQRREPYEVSDFVPWHEDNRRPKGETAILLEDPEQQTEAMINAMFGGSVLRA